MVGAGTVSRLPDRRADAPGVAPDTASVPALDGAAVVALYEELGAEVYSFTLWMTGSARMAEEITEEVFLRVWRHPQKPGQQARPLRGLSLD